MIRLRRHTDGRVAVYGPSGYWLVVGAQGHWVANEPYVSHPGWSELLVAELPEPDYSLEGDRAWDVVRIGAEVVASPKGELTVDDDPISLETTASDALKVLAAVAACKQYRAQQEATT